MSPAAANYPARTRRQTALLCLVLVLAQPALSQDAGSEDAYLDVNIRVFEAGLPDNPQASARQNVFPVVRRAEARYIPAFLRRQLVAAQAWGAVRIVPEIDPSTELAISGTIVRSDGGTLALAIQATDSTGRTWIDRRYEGRARPGVSLARDTRDQDDFLAVYERIAADLQARYSNLSSREVQRIKSVALLRYGASLAPSPFEDYLERDDAGRYTFSRLPAADSPLLERVREIRRRQYLFIDVVDEQYRAFFQDIKPVYDLWREYRREQQAGADALAERESAGSSDFAPGSYLALRESYDNYRRARLQEQYLDELADGFANEVQATEIDLENRIYRLTGSLMEQYREWRDILQSLFAMESGDASIRGRSDTAGE